MMETGALVRPAKNAAPGADEASASAQRAAKWLVIASGKGGTTKTTTSLNLASLAAAAGLKIGILDTDEQATLTKWHKRRERQDDVPSLRLFSVPLVDLKRGVREVEKVEAAEGLDLVIVDTPPGLEQRERISELVRRADYVLVPTSQSTADLESALEFMAAISSLGVRAAFLLSRTNQRWGSYRLAKKMLNRAGTLCPVDVRQLRDIEATHDYGLGINEFSKAKGADDLEAVWEFIRKAMEV
jgi:chromosome partitioning protein